MALDAGSRLGHYEITALLGEGGMGRVYRAVDATLQRAVAIKVLSEADEHARTKLLHEARSASALSHPNVATVYEVGEHEGQPFIVMELVEGKRLSELIPSDGLPPETVLRHGLQIADGLAHAHEQGIVHRDLKSQNVVITPEGRAKVLDFGLAMRLEPQDAEAVTVTVETPADTGTIAGTLAYMAPEVLRGEVATARSDVWALGVLLYEMVSGHLPFGGENRTDVVTAIVKDTPPPLPRGASAGLRAIVQRCLTKEPGQRYASAIGVQAALEAVQTDSVSGAPVETRAPTLVRLTRRITAAVAVLAIPVGVGYWLLPSESVSPPVLQLTAPQQVTSGPGLIDHVSWSQDSATLTFAYHESRLSNDIWVTPIGGLPLNRTPDHPGRDQDPAFSPDGRDLAFFSDRDGGGIFRMSSLAGAPLKVASAGGHPHWLAQGTQLAYVVSDTSGGNSGALGEIEITTLATDESRRMQVPGTWGRRYELSWSADERFLAYVDKDDNQSFISQLWVYRFSDGEAFPITDARTWNESPSWAPDGRTLYFVSNRGGGRDLWQQRLTAAGEPDGELERVTAGVGMWRAQLSPDGAKLAYVRGGQAANVWRAPIFTDRVATWADATQLTFDRAWIIRVDVSPNGDRLVIDSDRSGNLDVWTLAAVGGPMQQLTRDPTLEVTPRWSPDGENVVFTAYRSGSRDIWIMPSGGGPARQITKADGGESYPAWSPDGTEVVYRSFRSGLVAMEIVNIETGQHRVIGGPNINLDWSPDGQWIAFRRGGTDQLWRIPPVGGEAELLTQGRSPRWSADGRQVYFLRTSQEELSARVLTIEDGTDRQLMDFSDKTGDISPDAFDTDGEYLYFAWREDQGDIWVMDVVQDEQ